MSVSLSRFKAIAQRGLQICGVEIRRSPSNRRFLAGCRQLIPTRSANHEDQIIFALLGQPKGGYCVEVGAYDGKGGSNSLLFERNGWKCVLVEADPFLADQCVLNRPKAITYGAAAVAPEQEGRITFQVIENGRSMSSLSYDEAGERHFDKHGVAFVPTPVEVDARTIDSMLEEAGFPRVDFISIDVEGHEASALRGFSLDRWQPRIVMLERIQAKVNSQVADIMEQSGYRCILSVPLGATEDCNDLWAKA